MSRYAIRLTHTDRNQKQSKCTTNGYRDVLLKHHVNWDALSNDLESVFLASSGRRSQFFFNFSYRKYVQSSDSRVGQLAFYGVKGLVPEITRASNYVELMVLEQNELRDSGFADSIFDGAYIEAQETLDVNSPLELERTAIKVRYEINTELDHIRETARNVLARIWSELEKDTNTHVVIHLDDAENRSMPLLKEIYRLLPFKLRNSMGFMTNVEAKDIAQINVSSLPVHIFTQDKTVDSCNGQYRFPLIYVDAENPEGDSRTYELLHVLHRLEETIEENEVIFTRLFDYTESEIMRKKNLTADSFREFEEIVRMVNDGFKPWWEDNTIDSVERLIKSSRDQRRLWEEDEDTRRLALWILNSRLLKEHDLSTKIGIFVLDKDHSQREEYLNYLEDDLELGNWITAIEKTNTKTEEELIGILNKEQSKWDKEKGLLQIELENREQKIVDLGNENEKLKKKINALKKTVDFYEDGADVRGTVGRNNKGKGPNGKRGTNHVSGVNRRNGTDFCDINPFIAITASVLSLVLIVILVITIMGRGRMSKNINKLESQVASLEMEKTELQKTVKQYESLSDDLNYNGNTEFSDYPGSISSSGDDVEETTAKVGYESSTNDVEDGTAYRSGTEKEE